jgi:signal peptidase I
MEATPKPAQIPATTRDEKIETLPESIAGLAYVLVIGLFAMTFLFQNFGIPSGSMEKTLLIGDHVLVDRITLAPRTKMDASGSSATVEAWRCNCVSEACWP